MGAAGVTGSFYAVAKKIGGVSDWDGKLARPLASWQQLHQAHRSGFEIGSHSSTHVRLGELTDEEVRQEFESSEQLLGVFDVRSFCYPYGSTGPASISAVKRRGWVGLSLRKGIFQSGADLALVPRVVMAYGDRVPGLVYKIWVRPKLRRRKG